jgi:hypothetical protein
MLSIVKALIGLLLIGSGGPLLFLGLIRLGWRRHGTSPVDFAFLHLDWIVQPQLPYWFAHMQNLTLAGAGAIALATGAALLLNQFLRPKIAQRREAQ